MNKHIILIIILTITNIPTLQAKVYIWAHNNLQASSILEQLQKFHVDVEISKTIKKQDTNNLYIICDLTAIKTEEVPPYYIVYQSATLTNEQLSPDHLQKLSQAVAVWDAQQQNINRYRNQIHHYLFMPSNYEHIDPVILPCFLPTHALKTYTELLRYSNQKNTDISSHVPAIFCHSFLQNPHVIVEAGVRGGESTKPLYEAAQFCNSHLIGIDLEPLWAKSTYNAMDRAFCLEMNDLEFASYYHNSAYKDKKVDLVFIDTSHEYQHTLQEITVFVPLLSDHGMLMFHDSNVTPLDRSGYIRLNGSWDSAPGNPRGVTQAIKEYFELNFDEYTYCNIKFKHDDIMWHMIHYPFCNGLTVIKKIA